MPLPNIKLDIEKIEDLVAQKLAEILVRQLDEQKMQKINKQNQDGKSTKIYHH